MQNLEYDWVVRDIERQLAASEKRQDDNFSAAVSSVKLASISANKAINAAHDAQALLHEVQKVRDCTVRMIKAHSAEQTALATTTAAQTQATRELISVCSAMMLNCIAAAVLAGGVITVVFNMVVFNPTPIQSTQGGIQRVR
jgi:hypothetical protein